jgi:hypothetical protein
MNVHTTPIARREAAAESQMNLLAGIARTLRSFEPGDKRAAQGAVLLRKKVDEERGRACGLLEDLIREALPN